MPDNHIVLFDGVCNLCSNSVKLIIKNDPKGLFKFTSLQSKTGKSYVDKYDIDTSKTDSIVLIKNGKSYVKSSAALHIANKMKGLYPLLFGFIIIPSSIRDLIYDFIARNRYKWFGKKDECWLPTPDLKARFLE